MNTAGEIVEKINELNICSPHYIEDKIDMDGIKEVTTIDFDEHKKK